MREQAKFLIRLCAVALLAIALACVAQTSHKKAVTPPKPEPTEPELAEYIRGALLSLTPTDGMNDYLEVNYDATTKVLTVATPDGRCDYFMNALDANNMVWDVFDPSDSDRTREKLLRLTMISTMGKPARACYNNVGSVDINMPTNRARFLFSQPKADEEPDFQEHMATAFKKLIALDGGTAEKDLF